MASLEHTQTNQLRVIANSVLWGECCSNQQLYKVELTVYLSPCETTLARLQEVSTIPGTTCDIFCTPLGSTIKRSRRLRVLAAVKQTLSCFLSASCSHKVACHSLKLLKVHGPGVKHAQLRRASKRSASGKRTTTDLHQNLREVKQMAGRGGEASRGVQPAKCKRSSEQQLYCLWSEFEATTCCRK